MSLTLALSPRVRRHARMATGEKLTGSAWKAVRCDHCQTQYAFEVTRTYSGADAQRYLAMLLASATDNVPCPKCLSYNSDAVTRLRFEKYLWLLVICGSSLALNVLALGMAGAPHMLGAWWPLLLVVSASTAFLFLLRELLMKRHDPNSDALIETRRSVLSNKQTVLRGEEVVQINWG